MSKKKVLIFADYYLPGYKAGGPVKSLRMLIDLLSDEFDFYVITRNHDFMSSEIYDVPVETPVSMGKAIVYYLPKMQLSFVRDLIKKQKFDILYFNSFFSVPFSFLPLLLSKTKAKVILAPRGEFSPGALSIKKAKKKFFIQFAKIGGIYSRVKFHATSEQEINDIRRVMGNNVKIELASNIATAAADKIIKVKKENDSLKIVYLSRITPKKNLLFALQILQKITAGQIQFDIYGPTENAEYWQACQEVILALPKNIQANYKGVILPEEVVTIFSQYHLFFFPTLGENFGHVILESLSAGCPVLTSDQTPWALEKAECGWAIPLQDKAAYLAILKKLMQDNEMELNKLKENARQFVMKIEKQEELKRNYQRLFEDA